MIAGDLDKILRSRIAAARADLRRSQDVAAAEALNIQAQITRLEQALAALTVEKEAFILQLQAVKVLAE